MVEIGAGVLYGAHVWPGWLAEYKPHIGSIVVTAGANLTLPVGAVLRFHDLARFDVYGALFAQGTAIAPIVLTAAAAAPQPNSWSGLHLNTGSFANLDHVVVEYAGNSDGRSYGAVDIRDANVTLTNSTVWHNAGTGVYVSSGLTLTGATISDNGGHG